MNTALAAGLQHPHSHANHPYGHGQVQAQGLGHESAHGHGQYNTHGHPHPQPSPFPHLQGAIAAGSTPLPPSGVVTASSAGAGPSTSGSSSTSSPNGSAQNTTTTGTFSLPPPLDFDAIRRKQRAMTQQSAHSSSPGNSVPPLHHQQHFHGLPHAGHAARSALLDHSDHGSPATSDQSMSLGHNNTDSLQAALNQLMADHERAISAGQHPLFTQQQQQQQQQPQQQNLGLSQDQLHRDVQRHHTSLHQTSPHPPSTHHLQRPQHPHPLSQSLTPSHAQQQQQQHQHQPQQHHQTTSSPHPQSPFPQSLTPLRSSDATSLTPEEHARLLSMASSSFNSFAIDMDRSHQAATGLPYVSDGFVACLSSVRAAALSLCSDLAGISAALKAGGSATPGGGSRQTGASSWLGSSNDINDFLHQLQPQSQPSSRSGEPSSSGQQQAGGQNGRSGRGNGGLDSNALLNLFDGNQGVQPGLPPGPAEQMLDFLTGSSSSTPNPINVGRSDDGGHLRKRKASVEADGDQSPSNSSTALALARAKAAGKHKSRPPIEGVRRESVRYRNRKLLVDMREYLYKWLDTTEFCRIAQSYPQGSNGWFTVPVDEANSSAGTKRIFRPNFELGSDLYICNKELLDELIELGVSKVKEKSESYGMKEGVEAKDVVVDVAKDLMDSARHGYRANLKKQQEDEADAKAKSTRYKQQERHRTKVRNREVGAKRLRHPIPDGLLTMGLHSDDAASDQEDMHKMDKDEWRHLRLRKLQSKRGWEALSPRWRNRHLTKAYHLADTLSKSKQMPRWRRDGGIDLDPPMRLWGKTLPRCVFDPTWIAENESRIAEDPFHIRVEDRDVAGWKDEEHALSEDTEDELERYEREVTRLNRANRKKVAGTAGPSAAASSSKSQRRSSSQHRARRREKRLAGGSASSSSSDESDSAAAASPGVDEEGSDEDDEGAMRGRATTAVAARKGGIDVDVTPPVAVA